MKTIQISEPEAEILIECIRQSYIQYTGNKEIDDDVYEFNSKLDRLIERIKQ